MPHLLLHDRPRLRADEAKRPMTAARRVVLLLTALAAAVAGCGDSLPPFMCGREGGCVDSVARKTFQFIESKKVDLLFVVDDTAAMAPHLDAVATGFRQMAAALRGQTGPTSFHAGFIRAGGCDTTTRGATCGLAAPDQYARAEWCQQITNLTSADDETFACLGGFGATDCGPAQPLSVAQRLLAGPALFGWEGFLRPDAYLMIVVVAAEDDASPGSVVDIAARFKALKSDPGQVLASVIAPDACASNQAQPCRLVQFAEQFGSNGLILPISTGQLAAALTEITNSIEIDVQAPCFRNLLDSDPATPGLQATCSVDDVTPAPDGTWHHTILPSCDQSGPPCWRFEPGGGLCDGNVFIIDRGPDWCSETGTTDVVECLVSPPI
jgi:hypothetical protein